MLYSCTHMATVGVKELKAATELFGAAEILQQPIASALSPAALSGVLEDMSQFEATMNGVLMAQHTAPTTCCSQRSSFARSL